MAKKIKMEHPFEPHKYENEREPQTNPREYYNKGKCVIHYKHIAHPNSLKNKLLQLKFANHREQLDDEKRRIISLVYCRPASSRLFFWRAHHPESEGRIRAIPSLFFL